MADKRHIHLTLFPEEIEMITANAVIWYKSNQAPENVKELKADTPTERSRIRNLYMLHIALNHDINNELRLNQSIAKLKEDNARTSGYYQASENQLEDVKSELQKVQSLNTDLQQQLSTAKASIERIRQEKTQWLNLCEEYKFKYNRLLFAFQTFTNDVQKFVRKVMHLPRFIRSWWSIGYSPQIPIIEGLKVQDTETEKATLE